MNENTVVKKENSIRELIESSRFKSAVASALPSHLRPDRFVRVAVTALTRVPKLAECDQASFVNCMMQLSQFGLEPDGRNAHLIPFWNSRRSVMECQLIIDYKGLVDLAMRSGKVSYVHADKVCTNDKFDYNKGSVTKHEVNFKEPRGDAYAYYAICRNKDGTEQCEVMTKDEVQKIRQRSRAGNAGPWVTDFDEMGKKTVFRRLSKWLQLSPEYRDALDADADTLEEHRFDSSMPAIARPIIPKLKGKVETKTTEFTNEGPVTTGIERDKNLSGVPDAQETAGGQPNPPAQKPKLKRKKPKAEEDSASPNEAEMIKRLAEGKRTPEDLIKVAREEEWIDADQNTLKEVGEEQLGVLLENWPMVAEALDALPTNELRL